MFAEAAGWKQPIRFAAGVGGHMAAIAVARAAQRAHVKRLVFAHIGRPTLRALAAGFRPPFGELAHDGQVFYVRTRMRLRPGESFSASSQQKARTPRSHACALSGER